MKLRPGALNGKILLDLENQDDRYFILDTTHAHWFYYFGDSVWEFSQQNCAVMLQRHQLNNRGKNFRATTIPWSSHWTRKTYTETSTKLLWTELWSPDFETLMETIGIPIPLMEEKAEKLNPYYSKHRHRKWYTLLDGVLYAMHFDNSFGRGQGDSYISCYARVSPRANAYVYTENDHWSGKDLRAHFKMLTMGLHDEIEMLEVL